MFLRDFGRFDICIDRIDKINFYRTGARFGHPSSASACTEVIYANTNSLEKANQFTRGTNARPLKGQNNIRKNWTFYRYRWNPSLVRREFDEARSLPRFKIHGNSANREFFVRCLFPGCASNSGMAACTCTHVYYFGVLL